MKYLSYVASVTVTFLLIILVLLIVFTPAKCEHEMGKRFSFQFEGSTASSHIKPYCKNCNQYFESARFRGTPNDTSYLGVAKEHTDKDEFVGGEYYTISAIVSMIDHDFDRVRINCKIGNDDVMVFFSVEFREEFEDQASLLQIGDEITFHGRLYDTGFGFTDCERIYD